MESILKLVFLIVGIYVTYFVFDGFDDISKASVLKDFDKKNTIGGLTNGINWFFYVLFLCLLFSCYQDNSILL
jgi:uncharacterized membrane protein